MIPRLAILSALALCPLVGLGQSVGVTANAPITNFKLPVLNDDGVRVSLLRGSEGRFVNDTQIDLTEMQYTLFEEDGSNKVNTTLIAPAASVFLIDKRYKVQGSEGVRIIRDALDVSGTKWTFETDEKKQKHITLEKNVRVVFRAAFGDILK